MASYTFAFAFAVLNCNFYFKREKQRKKNNLISKILFIQTPGVHTLLELLIRKNNI